MRIVARFVLMHLHRRLREERVGPERAFGDRAVIHVAVQIDRRVRRRERPEIRETRHPRENTASRQQGVFGREIRVDPRKRAEPLVRTQFVLRPARHVGFAQAELRGLLEEEPIADDRTTRLESRRERTDSDDVDRVTAARGSKGGVEIVQARLPCVARTPRAQHDEPGREPPELDGVWVRHHRNRLDRIVGQEDAREASGWVDERRRSDLHARLIGPSTLDAYAARHLDDAGEQTER